MAIEIPVPALEMQRKIVCTLDRISELVDEKKTIVDLISGELLPIMMHLLFRSKSN